MATAVSICSNALLMLGAQPINSFDDPYDRARLAANLWPDTRDAILRSHPWNAATQRVQLAPDATVPAFDYSYQFTIPTDWLKTLQIGEIGIPVDYRSEGRKILCDENPLDMVYIFRAGEGQWDSSLVFAATLAMQSVMAYAITQSAAMQQSSLAQLQAALRSARASDGMDDPPDTLGDFRLLASRGSSQFPVVR